MDSTGEKMTISISTGTMIRAAIVVLSFWLLYMLRDLSLILLTAIVIASAIEPSTRVLMRYRIPRTPSVILIYLLLFVFLAGMLYFFIPPLALESLRLARELPAQIARFDILSQFGGDLGSLTEQFRSQIGEGFNLAEQFPQIQKFLGGLSGGFLQAASFIFGGAFSFILILIFSFYLAVQERGIENFLRLVTPAQSELYIIDLWQRTQRKIGLWLQGQLLLGFIIGVFTYLGLAVLGIKFAFTLAVLAAAAELVPIFGPILAAIPAVIFGFVQGPTVGFMTLGLYIIIGQFENHLLYPLVVKKIVGVPALLVILSLIVGGTLAGFLGILLSVPIAAALMEFLDDIGKKKHPAVQGA